MSMDIVIDLYHHSVLRDNDIILIEDTYIVNTSQLILIMIISSTTEKMQNSTKLHVVYNVRDTRAHLPTDSFKETILFNTILSSEVSLSKAK